MAIVRFFKMAAVCHLDFVMRMFGLPTKAFGGLYHCAKFGRNRYSSFANMQDLIFCQLGLKMPILASKIGVLSAKSGPKFTKIGEGQLRRPIPLTV